jgi:hypothetical protein
MPRDIQEEHERNHKGASDQDYALDSTTEQASEKGHGDGKEYQPSVMHPFRTGQDHRL